MRFLFVLIIAGFLYLPAWSVRPPNPSLIDRSRLAFQKTDLILITASSSSSHLPGPPPLPASNPLLYKKLPQAIFTLAAAVLPTADIDRQGRGDKRIKVDHLCCIAVQRHLIYAKFYSANVTQIWPEMSSGNSGLPATQRTLGIIDLVWDWDSGWRRSRIR